MPARKSIRGRGRKRAEECGPAPRASLHPDPHSATKQRSVWCARDAGADGTGCGWRAETRDAPCAQGSTSPKARSGIDRLTLSCAACHSQAGPRCALCDARRADGVRVRQVELAADLLAQGSAVLAGAPAFVGRAEFARAVGLSVCVTTPKGGDQACVPTLSIDGFISSSTSFPSVERI